MIDSERNRPLLSLQIMLPDHLDRRLAKRTNKVAGASWPAWGGHITLVPHFMPQGTLEAVRITIAKVCAGEEQFVVRFASPLAIQDTTRPDYWAVFLTVEATTATVEERATEKATGGQASGSGQLTATGASDGMASDGTAREPNQTLDRLRNRLLEALEPLREDLHPELVEQPFLPHITIALGVGEAEARTIVRAMHIEPVDGEFWVDTLWLVMQQAGGDGDRVDRVPIPLGGVDPAELLRD